MKRQHAESTIGRRRSTSPPIGSSAPKTKGNTILTTNIKAGPFAHAGGSHEHANIIIDHKAGILRPLDEHRSLRPWPASNA
jgi:hypothetical protein